MVELSNLSWIEASDKFKETKLAIIPTGAVEQHGLHLGVGADWFQAWNLAKKVGEKTDTLVLPVLPYGVSSHHKDFPGTIFLNPETFQKVVGEILSCLNRYGITKVIIINGHGGNLSSLINAAKIARDKYDMLCAVVQWWDMLERKLIFGQPAETHAGYAETALMMATNSGAVKMERAVLTATKQVDADIQLVSLSRARFKDGSVRLGLKTADVSDTGSMTEHHPDELSTTKDYSMITSEFGRNLMDDIVDWLCEFIGKFEKLELPPIKVTKEKALKKLEE